MKRKNDTPSRINLDFILTASFYAMTIIIIVGGLYLLFLARCDTTCRTERITTLLEACMADGHSEAVCLRIILD